MALCDKTFCCESTIKGWGKLVELNSPDIIEKLFNRLPYKLKPEFISKSSCNSELGDFSELRKILERAAKDADGYLGQHLYESLNKKKETLLNLVRLLALQEIFMSVLLRNQA